MARPVSQIIQSPHLKAIESALLDKVPQRKIASRYGVSLAAVSRYATSVVKPALANIQVSVNKVDSTPDKLVTANDKAEQIALIRQQGTAALLEKRLTDYDRIIDKAEKAAEFGACASLINSETTRLRLLAELSGELQPATTQTTAIVLLMPQQPTQGQPMQADAIDAEWTPG